MSTKKEIANYFDLAVPRNVGYSKHCGPFKQIQRASSTSILEKYTKVLKKDEELQERKERTRRLRENFTLKFTDKENETNSSRSSKGTMPSPNFENFYNMSPRTHRQSILKSRNKLHTRTWSSIETEQQFYNYTKIKNSPGKASVSTRRKMSHPPTTPRVVGEGARTVSPVPENHNNDNDDLEFDERLKIKRMLSLDSKSAVPDAVQGRLKQAEIKRKERLLKLKALDEDCIHAQKIISKLQAIENSRMVFAKTSTNKGSDRTKYKPIKPMGNQT